MTSLPTDSMHLILYSKPGCHLCEGLQEKLEQVTTVAIALEIRDITTQDDWFQAYQYEIPILMWVLPDAAVLPEGVEKGSALRLPRLSPRASIAQVEQMLQTYQRRHQPE